MSPNEFSPTTSRATVRRRSILLASVFGLAVAGFAATQTFIPQTPALAQIRTERSPGQYSFADIVDKVRPAVVSVKVKVDTPQVGLLENNEGGSGRENLPPQVEQFMRRFFGEQPGMGQGPRNRRVTGQGSGFFVSADGFIVTNNHVVERATEVDVTTDDGKTYTAKVVGSDPRTDVALLKVEGRGNDFPWVKFSAITPRVGDWVLAVGNPFGLGGTVTSGIVSARGRDIGAGTYDDFLQIDAAVNRGNSGGPTFNLAGEVIGVNTAIVSPSGGNIGIAFAIPAETVERVVASLKETGSVTRGYLGVQIQPVTPEIAESLGVKEAQGALVADVQADTPAAKAGIKAGDVVLSVDGHPIKDARELSRRIAGFQPGATVKLNVLRDGKERTFEIVLSKLPEQRAAEKQNTPKRQQGAEVPRLGLSLAPANSVAGAGSEGVVVTEVDPKGPAAERGLKSGDVILEVAGRVVANPAEVRDAIGQAQKDGKGVVLMRVKSENGTRFVTVPVGRG